MLVLGHRGASQAAEENTATAFRLADQMGADGIELDLRRVSDGRLLIAHDPLPDDLDEVDRLGLATLDDALDASGTRMLVNVEIKNVPIDAGFDPTMAMVAPTIETLRRRGDAAGSRWLISSFSWETLAACREVDPAIPTAWLCLGVDRADVDRIAAAGHAAVHPHERSVDAGLVAVCHRAGLAVNTWTCNDGDRLAELAAIGVDGVCTDVPDVAMAALGRARADVNPSWRRWPHSAA